MRLNYIGRQTAVAMVVIGRRTLICMGAMTIIALMATALAKPLSCGSFYQIKRPEPPMCIDRLRLNADDSALVQSCRAQLSSYVDEMDQYSRCLVDENKEAVNEGNATIAKFNCIVRHQSGCY